MRIYRNFDHIPPTPLVACIGFFDGVHLGHRYLLNRLKERAEDSGCASAVVTFANHPRTVISPDVPVALIDTPEEKSALLAACGVDVCLLLDFTPQLMETSAEDFIALLAERGHIKTLLVGYDHRFGRKSSEGFDDYVRYGERHGVEVVRMSEYETPGQEHCSSSQVRRWLARGEVLQAGRLLGRPYRLEGTIVHGHSLGRVIGFPTANLRPSHPHKLIPATGVYAAQATLDDGLTYPAMVNIGCRPTVASSPDCAISIEAHLIGFDGNLYDRSVTLSFIARIRDERKMSGLEELCVQLQEDRTSALQLLQAFASE